MTPASNQTKLISCHQCSRVMLPYLTTCFQDQIREIHLYVRKWGGICLTEKASEYYAFVIGREMELGYLELVDKLERRFGDRAIPETEMVTPNLRALRKKPPENETF
ncbi:hypothetical protein DPMN_080012 [Dreissena polymorpha]|uniref:Uncharacterized protein n=1 Tax=Dreissena polymorpha TaxID=45954 RepID=A0A9D3YTN2_DREPO|nr:hypothetical protein DPMN_080012 [Dreissena polymorpha]